MKRNGVAFFVVLFLSASYAASTMAQDGSVKWTYDTGSIYVKSSPIIGDDGVIYVAGRGLHAINPDGSEKWKVTTAKSIGPDGTPYGGSLGSSQSHPTMGADGVIYISGFGLYAFLPDGSQKWGYKYGGFMGAAALGGDGAIYSLSSMDGHLYAINPDGSVAWSYPTKSGNNEASPVVGSDGVIYIGSSDHKLYAINPDGSLKWIYETGDWIVSTPAIGSDGVIYTGSNDGKLYALNPDGSLQWSLDSGCGGCTLRSSPAIGADGTIYVGAYSALAAVTPAGALKWTYPFNDWVDSSPSVGADGTIYVGSDDDNLYALNPDGTLKWSYKTGDYVSASPAIGPDGTVYVSSQDGKLYALNGSSGGLADTAWPMFRHDLHHTGNPGNVQGPSIDPCSDCLVFGGNYAIPIPCLALGADKFSFTFRHSRDLIWDVDPNTIAISSCTECILLGAQNKITIPCFNFNGSLLQLPFDYLGGLSWQLNLEGVVSAE